MALLARTIAGFVFLFAVMALVVFGAAGTVDFWPGWALIGVFAGCSGLITVWLWGHDKALLGAGIVFLATFAVPGLDHRFGWSHVPVLLVIGGDVLVALGFWIVFRVFRENTFTSGTIEIAEGQSVIDTGPYALVRHPMYAGALIMFVGIPLALGSWWGLAPAAGIVPVLIWRLSREEQFLATNLTGYDAYRGRVRARLIPSVW